MIINKESTTKVIQEHEAVRASFKWLETSVSNIIPPSDALEITPQQQEKLRVAAKNLLELLNSMLYGFKEHFERDQQVLKPMAGIISLEKVDKDHVQIEKKLDRIVKQTELALQKEWNDEDFIRYLSRAQDLLHKISILVDRHTKVEDDAIKKGLSEIL